MSDIETGGNKVFPFIWITASNYLKQLYEGSFNSRDYDGFMERDVYESVKEWITGYIENIDVSNTSGGEDKLIP